MPYLVLQAHSAFDDKPQPSLANVPDHTLCMTGVGEAAVLILAIRRSNMPKFLLDDAVLFEAIVSDLFPGMDAPEQVSMHALVLCNMN